MKGSLFQLKLASSQYEDILDVQEADDPCKILILCKENYDIDMVLEFTENIPLGVDYEIKTVYEKIIKSCNP